LDTTRHFEHGLRCPCTEGSDADLGSVEILAEEFLERQRRGERPEISEYTDRYPELADHIRAFFPALVLVERLKTDGRGSTDGRGGGPWGAAPERLGEYRILREVGRGGMGVVYEALQESLGRRVALKVLAAPGLKDPRRLLRFRREARAAAGLHHTNIVPVFGVGESDGMHYYVMQFIPGLGLDAVLKEARRLRGVGIGVGGDAVARAAGEDTPPATDVARSLARWRFADWPPPVAGDEPAARASTPATGAAAPTAVLPGDSRACSATKSAGRYAQSVARIGVQVAGALDYAHGQGILHRDIKPSNLLLDGRGTVWVADFGLAKAADSDDLTHTGDVVGTLRYMAPERFDGRCGPESDVYSLGLTLYELLALRPAFEESDRRRLIRLVTHSEPLRLRKLEPSVPRDLETIIHKAIDRDPRHRYAAAGELAEDLRRFLDGREIRARRLSPPEQAWRWCRRRPTEAALGVALLALVALAIGGGLWAYRQRAEAALRQTRACDSIVAMLAQAATLRQGGLWSEAGAALDQAGRRLEDVHDPHLNDVLRQARSDLDLAARLEECRIGRASHQWSKADYRRAAKDYAAAFAAAGLTPLDDPALVGRIRRSAIHQSVVSALDDWALVTDDERLRAQALKLARQIDPDPAWRDRLRDPGLRGDRPRIERLAAEALAAVATDRSPQVLLSLGLVLKDAGGDPEPLLRAAQEHEPDGFWINVTLGDVLSAVKPADAVGFYRAALVKPRRAAWVWNNLGLAFERMGRLDEAVSAYRRATDLDPDGATAYGNLGIILERQGRHDEAATMFRRAIEIGPAGALTHNYLGLVLMRMGRLAEAETAFRTAIQLGPGVAAAYYNLGLILEDRGRHEAAVALYRTAVALDPVGAAAYYNLAGALNNRLGRTAEAIEVLDRLTDSHPGEHDAWNYSAILRAWTGDRSGYRRHCLRMLAGFSGTGDSAIAERTAKACLLLPLGGAEQDAACRLAEGAMRMSRHNWVLPWAQVTRGLADYRRARFADAVAAIDSCLSRGPANWNCELPARLIRAMALSRLGRPGEARAALGRASELYQRCVSRPGGPIPGGNWADRLIGEVLLREAEPLILDPTFPDDPFAA
jgi:serine/threonine protein kinase/tetratricopeptide (TPR) repeat protein